MTIYGQKWEVRCSDIVLDSHGIPCCGHATGSTKVIEVAIADKDEMWATLIHEMGHAITYRGGLIQTGISDDLFEIIVDQFGVVISENFTMAKKK